MFNFIFEISNTIFLSALLPQFLQSVQNLEALKMFLLTISETTVRLSLSINILMESSSRAEY